MCMYTYYLFNKNCVFSALFCVISSTNIFSRKVTLPRDYKACKAVALIDVNKCLTHVVLNTHLHTFVIKL